MTDINREFVALDAPNRGQNPVGYHACQGLYVTPTGERPRTAVIASHYSIDFAEHYLGPLMARRGFGFLGWNTRFRGAEIYFRLGDAMLDISVGIRWLREHAGVERVVVLGNSGGGSLMAAYQSQASAPSLTPRPFRKLPEGLDALPTADRYVSLQAHLGRPEVLTAWIDPSVTDELDPASVDTDLDMYNPTHGPPYSKPFVDRYRAAQRARNQRITAWALAELERLAELGTRDRVFTVPRVWADLRLLDGELEPSDRTLGRCYIGDPRRANYSPYGIAATNTLRSWLEMWSLEASDCVAPPHLAAIDVPSLVIQSTGDAGVFPSDARAIHQHPGADDERLELVAGDHYLSVPRDRDAVADMIADWLL